MLLGLGQNPFLGTVSAAGYRSWVNVDIMSFDGESITAKITIVAAGNHEDAAVRLWGEIFESKDQIQPCPTGSSCVSSSVTASVGRIVSEVTYLSDPNVTTFQYTARWVSTYKVANQIFGLPLFPLDEHELTITISSDFDMVMDGHERIPNLPTSNYQGFFRVAPPVTPSGKGPYEYQLNLRIAHSFSFQLSMSIWTWGVVFLLILTTAGLLVGMRKKGKSSIVTAASALVVFVPVYELALQSFKAPLGMTLSDVIVFLSLTLDVVILVLAIRRRGEGKTTNRATSQTSET